MNPEADLVDGERCFRSLVRLPEPVGAVLVVVPPAQALGVVREAAAAGIKMFAKPTGVHKAHKWIWGLLGKLPA